MTHLSVDYETARKFRSRAVLDITLGWHDQTDTAPCCCALLANCPHQRPCVIHIRSPQMTANRHFCVTSVRCQRWAVLLQSLSVNFLNYRKRRKLKIISPLWKTVGVMATWRWGFVELLVQWNVWLRQACA